MPINLSRIGHVAMRVSDLERSKDWYSDVLGFTVMEQDIEHGDDVFMSLGRQADGHVLDIVQVESPDSASPAPDRNSIGIAHIALKVDTHDDLKGAYEHLLAKGVTIDRMIEHVNQRSMYFADPDGNRIEIYFEYPTSKELFERGRGDRDFIFDLDDPLPTWAHEVPADWDPEKTVDSYHRGRIGMRMD